MEKIKKRKDGRYELKVYLGKINGNDKYKSVYVKNQKEVKQKALDVKLKAKQGINILSGDRTKFEFWANAWLHSIEDSQNADNYKTLSVRTNVWIDMFKNVKIEDIRVIDCQEIINDIAKSNPRYRNRPSSDKTITEYLNILVRIFDFCLKNRILTFNPALYVNKPKGIKKAERMPLTNEQIKYFEDTKHPLQLCCLLMIYAGLRRGEALALTWNDIDFDKKTITINKSANLKQNGIIKEPKTKAGYRNIPITKKLYNLLKAQMNNSILVITHKGKSIDSNTWERLWRGYIRIINKKYDIELKTSAHCLRHTFCTLLYEAGVDVLTAKTYMGHSDISVTMGIYTHLREQQEKISADKLDRYLLNL